MLVEVRKPSSRIEGSEREYGVKVISQSQCKDFLGVWSKKKSLTGGGKIEESSETQAFWNRGCALDEPFFTDDTNEALVESQLRRHFLLVTRFRFAKETEIIDGPRIIIIALIVWTAPTSRASFHGKYLPETLRRISSRVSEWMTFMTALSLHDDGKRLIMYSLIIWAAFRRLDESTSMGKNLFFFRQNTLNKKI